MPAVAGAPVRVVLYGRAGCHLCDEARTLVQAVCAEQGVGWREVDVDAPDAAPLPNGEPVLEAYGELVPVVEVDGVRQGYWRIDAGRVRAVLAAGAPRS
jgi:glutaredoxin